MITAETAKGIELRMDRIKGIISKMTLEEKIGQLWQVPFSSARLDEIKALAAKGKIGSCILACTPLAGNTDNQELPFTQQLNMLQKEAVEKSKLQIPLIFARDVVHGQRTIFPIPLAQAAAFDRKAAEDSARRMTDEAKQDGVHWTFAPMMDIARDPRWGRVIEGYGEDPYLASEMAAAAVRGIQHKTEDGHFAMAACAKHYIGYGAVEGGREYEKGEISDYTLKNVYLKPFKAAIRENIMMVMSGFHSIGGEAIIASERLLKNLLKKELGFGGFVISDYDSVEQLITRRLAENKKDCAAIAFKSGVDMEMVTDCFSESLSELVKEGIVSESEIDDAVERILRVKEKVGLFENPYTHTDPTKQYRKEDREASLKAAEKTLVLLKNNGVLPLPATEKIALCGPFVEERRALHGSWAGYGDIPSTPNFKEEMDKYFGKSVVYCNEKFDITGRDPSIIRGCDVIVLALGEKHTYSGERAGISDIRLDPEQTALAVKAHNAGKKVVAVLFTGRLRSIYELEPYVDAVLLAWQPGSTGAEAAARALCGKVNPGGKLPMTMVKSSGQIPLYYNQDNNPCCISDSYYDEPEFAPYSDFSAMPMYPFGFGLSYTQFKISNICVEKGELFLDELKNGAEFKITADVSNIGKYDGDEVIQLYIRDVISSMCRPVRELKGFERISLKCGETKKAVFTLDISAFSYEIPGKGEVAERGKFEIYVGNSCTAALKICVCII